MKTTVDLPEALLVEVRAAAKRHGRTMSVMFEESLRTFLDWERGRAPATPGRLKHTIVSGQGPVNPALTFAEMLEISASTAQSNDRRRHNILPYAHRGESRFTGPRSRRWIVW